MQMTRDALDEAVAKGPMRNEQGAALWAFLAGRAHDTPTFKPAHIPYYLGGMIAIGTLSLFMTLGWERFGGAGLLVIAAGVVRQRREAVIGDWLHSFLPAPTRHLVAHRADL